MTGAILGITAALIRIEGARGFLAATLSEDWIRAMGEQARVLEFPEGIRVGRQSDSTRIRIDSLLACV